MTTATLLIGVNLTALYKEETVGEEITKYDEDTGKPYKKTVTTTKSYYEGFEIPEDADFYEFFEELGLDYLHNEKVEYIGIKLADANCDYNEISTVNLNNLPEKVSELKSKLSKLNLQDTQLELVLENLYG